MAPNFAWEPCVPCYGFNNINQPYIVTMEEDLLLHALTDKQSKLAAIIEKLQPRLSSATNSVNKKSRAVSKLDAQISSLQSSSNKNAKMRADISRLSAQLTSKRQALQKASAEADVLAKVLTHANTQLDTLRSQAESIIDTMWLRLKAAQAARKAESKALQQKACNSEGAQDCAGATDTPVTATEVVLAANNDDVPVAETTTDVLERCETETPSCDEGITNLTEQEVPSDKEGATTAADATSAELGIEACNEPIETNVLSDNAQMAEQSEVNETPATNVMTTPPDAPVFIAGIDGCTCEPPQNQTINAACVDTCIEDGPNPTTLACVTPAAPCPDTPDDVKATENKTVVGVCEAEVAGQSHQAEEGNKTLIGDTNNVTAPLTAPTYTTGFIIGAQEQAINAAACVDTCTKDAPATNRIPTLDVDTQAAPCPDTPVDTQAKLTQKLEQNAYKALNKLAAMKQVEAERAPLLARANKLSKKLTTAVHKLQQAQKDRGHNKARQDAHTARLRSEADSACKALSAAQDKVAPYNAALAAAKAALDKLLNKQQVLMQRLDALTAAAAAAASKQDNAHPTTAADEDCAGGKAVKGDSMAVSEDTCECISGEGGCLIGAFYPDHTPGDNNSLLPTPEASIGAGININSSSSSLDGCSTVLGSENSSSSSDCCFSSSDCCFSSSSSGNDSPRSSCSASLCLATGQTVSFVGHSLNPYAAEFVPAAKGHTNDPTSPTSHLLGNVTLQPCILEAGSSGAGDDKAAAFARLKSFTLRAEAAPFFPSKQ